MPKREIYLTFEKQNTSRVREELLAPCSCPLSPVAPKRRRELVRGFLHCREAPRRKDLSRVKDKREKVKGKR